MPPQRNAGAAARRQSTKQTRRPSTQVFLSKAVVSQRFPNEELVYFREMDFLSKDAPDFTQQDIDVLNVNYIGARSEGQVIPAVMGECT